MAKDGLAQSLLSSHSSLPQEADSIYPYICQISQLYDSNLISSPDYVGLYVLIYISIRRPKAWSNGKLNQPIYESVLSKDEKFSSKLSNYPEIVKLMGGDTYLTRKLRMTVDSAEYSGLTVVSIFNLLQLSGIKKNKDYYVNRSIVYWAISYYQSTHPISKGIDTLSSLSFGEYESSHQYNARANCDYDLHNSRHHHHEYHRPFQLMFTISSPLQVLRQQANGQRVLTLFRNLSELSSTHKAMLYYMDGMQNHEKDALEFLLHDMCHMEHFTNPSIHFEQVGFFRCMLKLEKGHPKRFFITHHGYDEQLWRELEYVISDMNCHVPHLMNYLLAKMTLASTRCYSSSIDDNDSSSDLDGSSHGNDNNSCCNGDNDTNSCSHSSNNDTVTTIGDNVSFTISNSIETVISNLENHLISNNTTSHTSNLKSDISNELMNGTKSNEKFNIAPRQHLERAWSDLLQQFGMNKTATLESKSSLYNICSGTDNLKGSSVDLALSSLSIDNHDNHLTNNSKIAQPTIELLSTTTETTATTKSESISSPSILRNVYDIAYGMIAASNRERGAMTAEEGEIVREFFWQQSQSQSIS